MADTFGVADRGAMHGILRQLARTSVNGQKPDAVNLAFMISMVKGIKPRDSVEAMLVAWRPRPRLPHVKAQWPERIGVGSFLVATNAGSHARS